MAPRTSNLYGKIIISKRAIRHVVSATAAEAYGVASARAGKLSCENNCIKIDVNVYLKFGVTIDPVIDSVRRALKYNVETFTGMVVDCVNINVLGIRN